MNASVKMPGMTKVIVFTALVADVVLGVAVTVVVEMEFDAEQLFVAVLVTVEPAAQVEKPL